MSFPQPNLGEIKYPKYLNSLVHLIRLPPISTLNEAERGAREHHKHSVLL